MFEIINSDFTSIALMSSILVFFVLLLTYGRIELTLISFVPMFITFIWILGIMGIFEVPFNPANIMTLPLIIGIGVTNGIHILNRFAEEQNPSVLARSTGKADCVPRRRDLILVRYTLSRASPGPGELRPLSVQSPILYGL